MIETASEIQPYVGQFESLADQCREREPDWLTRFRRQAMDRFTELGFPTTRWEDWKYTDVRPIAETRFTPGKATHRIAAGQVDDLIGTAPLRLVFVNGRFAQELSRTAETPDGLTLQSMAVALAANPAALKAHLANYARFEEHPFVALNTALFVDGAFIHIARGAVIEEPIHLLFLSGASDEPIVSHPRNLIVAEESSQATIIETYAGFDGEAYFTNAVTEVYVAENATLDHYKVQRESDRAFHVATQQLEQARSSNFTSHGISFGGSLVRNDINARLGGEGIESTINGLYVLKGRQHVDNHTAIDHAMPHCNSHELYKGIMDDRSTGVFNGKIFVRQDAQKTDAKQTNQNLLLSNEAVIDTKPQLEIYADDVRCTHGATVGQLDADALFYLRARGIPEREARNMLIHAFASDVLDRIRIESLRERLEDELMKRLAR